MKLRVSQACILSKTNKPLSIVTRLSLKKARRARETNSKVVRDTDVPN